MLFLRALAPFFIAMLCVIVPTGAMATVRHRGHRLRGGAAAAGDARAGRWTGPEVPGDVAVLLRTAPRPRPADAPDQVKQAIWAANALQELPYRYGGGHNLQFDVVRAPTAPAPSRSRCTPPACSRRRSTPARS